jgi:hypothetical protein
VTQTTDSAGDGIHRGDTFCADPNTPCDPTLDPDHTADQFVILLGADGQVNQFGSGPPTLKVDLSTGSLRRFTVAELQRLAQDPQDLTVFCNSQGCDEDKKTLAPTFIKTADAQQLLAMDPYFAHEQLDQHPERFEPACKTAGTCASPERLTVDSKPASPATAADPTVSETHLQGNGSESSNGSSTGLKEDLTIFGIGGTTSITYEDVTTVSNFTSQSASVTFENSSHCEKGTVDLWLDKSFGSFLWVTHLENACQQQPMQTMSFEALADWQIQGGGAATLSAQRVTGDHAFSISAQGWTPVVSIPLGSALLRGAATSTNLAAVSFALSIPTNQPNPFWIGAAQMYISAPSANIYNAYMGQVELTPLPEGQFVRLGFTIPDYALHALTENHPDVSFTIVLNVNAGTSGWLVDDLSIGN